MCLKRNTLPQSLEVQKNILLIEVLKDLECFNTREEAYKKGYVPVNFVTVIRTLYSNLVVEHEAKKGREYFISLNLEGKVLHKELDLLAFMSSIAVMKVFDFSDSRCIEAMLHSRLVFRGVYNPDLSICDPIFFCYVILGDDTVDTLNELILQGNMLVPIQDISIEGKLKELLRDLKEIEKEALE